MCGEFLGLLSVKERGIRLADVLYAHQWLRGGIHIGVNQAGRFMICGESTPMKGKYIFTMIGYEIPSLTPAMPEQVSWNLRADTLDEQSDECLTLLAGLLGNNQSDVPEI